MPFYASPRLPTPPLNLPPIQQQYNIYIYLQAVAEELVHLGHLGGNGEVNGAVADLDDEAAADVGVDLGHDLELLALADVLGL